MRRVQDPELKKSLVDLQMVRDVVLHDQDVRVTLALTTLGCPMKQHIVREVMEAVKAAEGISSVEVHLTAMTREELDR